MKILLFIRNVILTFVILFLISLVTNYYISLYSSSLRIEEARKIDPSIWDVPYQDIAIKNKYKILFITTHGAEWTEAKYIEKAARSMGWEVLLIYYSTQGHEMEILDFDPDFIITTVGNDNFHISPEIKHHRSNIFGLYYWPINTNIHDNFTLPVLGLFGEDYFDEDLDPNSRMQNLIFASDGLLLSAKEIKIIQELYERSNKPFYAIRVVPTVNDRNYEFSSPRYISIAGTTKDSKRRSAQFTALLQNLNKEQILKSYGDFNSYQKVSESWQGSISDPDMLLDELNKNGIVLVVHRDGHFQNGLPTNRIMEAAAANTLIISDKNSFVIEEFGDAVLYFDASADSKAMTDQIMTHYRWAQQYPTQAKTLANKAHQIFKKKFTSEYDLKRIARMHEKILLDKRRRK